MTTVRITLIVLIAALLYSSRLTRGTAKHTPEGLTFGMKPMLFMGRVLAVLVYAAYYVYVVRTNQMILPDWFPALVFVAFVLSMLRAPGTIVLGPTSITQRFWLMKTKAIQYADVLAVQVLRNSRVTQVVGNQQTVITHTSSLAAADVFRTEIALRTGRSLT